MLAFPCNQFLRQEPGTPQEIQEFARSRNANFPLFEKVDVNGKDTHDLYWYLRYHSSLKGGKIGWNFGKFLVDRNGEVKGYYGPRTFPLEFTQDIEKLL